LLRTLLEQHRNRVDAQHEQLDHNQEEEVHLILWIEEVLELAQLTCLSTITYPHDIYLETRTNSVIQGALAIGASDLVHLLLFSSIVPLSGPLIQARLVHVLQWPLALTRSEFLVPFIRQIAYPAERCSFVAETIGNLALFHDNYFFNQLLEIISHDLPLLWRHVSFSIPIIYLKWQTSAKRCSLRNLPTTRILK
jgi:hypothetical protein